MSRQNLDAAGVAGIRGFLIAVTLLVLNVIPVFARQEQQSCWVRGDPADLELRASPFDSTSVELSAGLVKVCYSRPRMLGRPIMGRLVPFGESWRFGADEATAIHVSFPASVAGVDVEPGSYTLYAVPAEEEWRIVINGRTQRWGIPIDEAVRGHDIGSGVVAVERTNAPVELLTLTLRRASPAAATLVAEWERTRVRIPIQAR